MGLFKALIDAVHGEDNRIAGQYFTRLTSPLERSETGAVQVETSRGFGEWRDGESSARILINGEIIDAEGRTETSFTTLTRGVDASTVFEHPVGSIVWDLSRNVTALDHARRGFFVGTALDPDLGVISRNLGLHRCVYSTDTWREIVKAIAYYPKQIITAYDQALDALVGAGKYDVLENSPDDPGGRWTIRIFIETELSNTLLGKFVLNGGEEALTTGTHEVEVNHEIGDVLSVYPANEATRLGIFGGATELFGGGGSHDGKTVTLTETPGPAGTPVIVNYTAFTAHYVPGLPETDPIASSRIPFNAQGALPPDASGIRNQGNRQFYAYLASPLASVECLLNQIRAAGIRLRLIVVSP